MAEFIPDLATMEFKVKSLVPGDELAAQLHDHIVGKTVVITGVSPQGLGAEAAATIARHQPKLLLLASRRPAAIASVLADLQAEAAAHVRPVAIEAVALDLGDFASVRAAAARILARTPVVDVLINNAGIMMLQQFEPVPVPVPGRPAGRPGIERQFATNHLGHFLLTNLLMPALLAAAAAAPGRDGPRVVNVSSRGYTASPVTALDDPALLDDTPAGRQAYDPFLAYAQSKTANLLFSVGLANKLGPKGLRAYGLDPGAVGTTQLSRNIPLPIQVAAGWRNEDGSMVASMPVITPQQSMANYIRAAFDPELNDHNGAMVHGGQLDSDVRPFAKDPVLADKLWTLSETLLGEEFQY